MISNQQEVAQITADDHPDKLAHLNFLSKALQIRFERLGNLEDLKNVISNQRQVVRLMSDDHPIKPYRLSNLGTDLRRYFEFSGNLEDLENAISNHQEAVHLVPDGHPDKPGQLDNLGIALQRRFEHLGILGDLESAISNHQTAVLLLPNGHPDKPAALSDLGTALHTRFSLLGTLGDLESAISSHQNAVQLVPENDPERPDYLNNLGILLRSRFERLGKFEDIDSAISSQQEAARNTADGHPEKPGRLNNLAIALLSRFIRLEGLKDLEGAISNQQAAIRLLPNKHIDKPTYLTNLGSAFHMRFERLRSLEDLNSAISNQQQAIQLVPEGHPDKPGRLVNLAITLQDCFHHINDRESLKSALSTFEQAFKSSTGPPRTRFSAALGWAQCAESSSVSPLPAYQSAINLLPRIAWLGIPVTDQYALLAQVGGAVRDAVAAAIRYQQYETAVEWAEQGRSIVWQNFLGLRTPLDDLRVDHPQLADQLEAISSQLETSNSLNNTLAHEWDILVDKIRLIPGFQAFLRPKSFNELAPAAYEGPVVILNDHPSHSDALVLIPDSSNSRSISVKNVPLKSFTSDVGKRLLVDLKSLLSAAGIRNRTARKSERVESPTGNRANFEDILGELWTCVVKPVIDSLAYEQKPLHPPRIWWCATGSLTFLPIHAAGLYGAGEPGDKLSDYVVSSYTPTLTAILDRTQPIIPEDFRILTVAEPSKSNPIPKTEEEVKLIKHLAGNLSVTDLAKKTATVEVVLEEMKKSHWVHLACHGKQGLDDPMKSGFLLHDERTLTLTDIIREALPKTEFAFLSACQTATGDERIAEESAHLAAGMFLSGCLGVIATMWSIQDDDAPKITQDVYSRILKDGRPNRRGAALALHEAVERLRKEPGASFISWVPFIHIGR